MHSAAVSLPLYTPNSSIITSTNNPNQKNFSFNTSTIARKPHHNSLACKASSSSSFSNIDFDLYDLLGVDSSSDHAQIKLAYRALQKRCHPDIAGPAGHDMAIILNEAYAVLSDPISRLAYDKEQAKMAELQGYTGKAIYSVWFGSAREERAVFVDEVKCVGCLKCALFAEKTFAVESVYGRARVVAQWADPEDKIQEAIESCPVDCISIVERSNLAALEFLMSKQPRGNVRVGEGNTVGTRVSNIFVDVEKFLDRYQDAMSKASKQNAKESEPQRKAKMSAIQAIRAVSNWLYWQSPNVGGTTSKSHLGLTRLGKSSAEPNVKKLKDAAATRKQARESGQPFRRIPSNYIYNDEYWIPSSHALPKPTKNSGSRAAVSVPSPSEELNQAYDENLILEKKRRSRNPIIWGVPVATATTAAVLVWLQVRDAVAGGLKEHVGGSMALDIVNSSWLQVILAGMAWYFIGVALVELVDAIQNKLQMHKK